jgi:COMPASS component SDC1
MNGNDVTSRATSQHPDPAPTIPKEAPAHGAPTRQYLNSKVTGPLLDGMKQIAKEQ